MGTIPGISFSAYGRIYLFIIRMLRKFKYIVASLILLLAIALLLPDFVIRKVTSKHIYQHSDSIPGNKAGLLLGTSKFMRSGKPNPFFYNRINAAFDLYKSGKIQYLVLSGDNSTLAYNEPKMMRIELLRLGIPDSIIYFDYAGFRTFDSVIRCRVIFGQTSFTIISQEFHLERALYIARYFGINAIGYEARGVGFKSGIRVRMREYLARIKVFFDIYSGYKPKFLGERIVLK